MEESNENASTLMWVAVIGGLLCICLAGGLAMAGAGAFIFTRTGTSLPLPFLFTPTPAIPPTFTPIPVQSDAPLYREDFDSEGSWSTFDDETGRAVVAGGALRVEASQPQVVSWARPGQEFDNFDLTVTAGVVDGPTNATYGVFLRVVDVGHYYYLQLSGEGSWSFYRYEEPNWITLVDFA